MPFRLYFGQSCWQTESPPAAQDLVVSMAQSSGRAARLARSKTPAQPQNAIAPLKLALVSIFVFGLFMFLPRVEGTPKMLESFAGAAVVLLAGLAALNWQVAKSGRKLFYEASAKPVHY